MVDIDDGRMDVSDSRKRSFEHEYDHSRQSKRTNSNGDSHDVLLKQLIPGTLAGAVLGKGGETITRLQTDTGAHIKLSKAGEFFPGTSDRICVISGGAERVKEANHLLWDRLRDRIEASSLGEECKMRLVVPHATVGMIIGKGGNYVKHVKEVTGAHVQISPKSNDRDMIERVVNIGGSMDSIYKAFDLLFKMIVEDPQSGSCPNISYSDMIRFVPAGPSFPLDMYMGQQSGSSSPGGRPVGPAAASAVLKAGGPQQVAAIEALKSTLRRAGHSAQATEEITAAMCTLASHGLLGLGIGFGGYGYGMGGVGGGGLSMEYLTGILCGAAGATTGGKNGDGGLYSGSDSMMGSSYAAYAQEKVKEDLQVSEMLVGAVLGHGGKAIVEIQKMTGAQVTVSHKGVFAPGTRNRVVTVTGTRAAVDRAMYHIQQYIQQEEDKRSRQDMHMKM